MRALILLAIATMLAGCGNDAQKPGAAPSILVSTVAPKQGSLPATVTAYGSVAPSLNGTRAFSEAQPGQVTGLMVTPGTAVRTGQRLATFETAPSSRSSYQQATSALVTARKQEATTSQLLAQQLATKDQMSQANKAVADAQAALAALDAEGAGQPVHTLVAPFDGIVTTVSVAQGDRTQPGSTILTLARAGGIVVTVGIDLSQRPNVALGQPATLHRLAGGAALAGHVVRVDGALNPLTRLIDVDVGFPSGSLLPGEGMQVAIETAQVGGWVVPHPSVVTASGAAHVFQLVGGKAKAVPVAVVLASGAGDVVRGAIDASRPLIVAGAYQVNDGDAVRRSN